MYAIIPERMHYVVAEYTGINATVLKHGTQNIKGLLIMVIYSTNRKEPSNGCCNFLNICTVLNLCLHFVEFILHKTFQNYICV